MPDPSQADILAALSAQSSTRKRPQAVAYDSLTEAELITRNTDGGAGAGPSRNARKVYCFREGCACLVLLSGMGEVVETEVAMLPDDPSSPFPSQSPASPSNKHLYLRVPTAFEFENIGYSRPASGDASTLLPSSAPGLAEATPGATITPADTSHQGGEATAARGKGQGQGVKVKWLICADCDLGPIGWGYEGGKEAYLDMRRCRYALEA